MSYNSSKHVYLAGAIDRAPDRGKAWRDELTPFLNQLGVPIFNPCLQEVILREEEATIDHQSPEWFALKRKIVQAIIDDDINALEKSEFVICYWDRYCTLGAGTAGEVTVAYRNKIPIYLVLGMPENETSSWIICAATEIFTSFDQLKEHLIKLYA